MNFFNRTFAQIRAALLGLSMSQRLLIGLLVVVMIATIFVVVHFSAKPEMIALLPQPATPAEINTMESYLKGKYTYQIETDKILVPVEQAYQIRGELAAAQALPRDTTAAFARLADASDYLLPDASIERRWNYARQEVLSRIIRNFPYVSDATVIISKGQMVGLGKSAVPSSASVSLRLKQGDGLAASQVLAIVDLVRGAVAGLRREDVHVTDGARSYTTPNEDQVMPTDLLAYKRSIEDDLARKLRDQFSHMGDVKIAVNVIPDMSAKTIRSQTYDPTKIAKAATEEQTKETNTSEGTGGGGQPGVQPNVSANTGGGAGGGAKSSSTTGDSTTKTEVRFSSSDETKVVPSGTEIRDMTASISLPRSFFRALFRRGAKDDKAEPSDEQLQPLIDSNIKRVQGTARLAIGAKTDEQIRVDWFDDTLLAATEIPVQKSTFAMVGGAGTVM
ncbi:MAG: flagellar M-ring protein FliF C-terminal domain-containing protein, partial [Phycisphaerae bacterium]